MEHPPAYLLIENVVGFEASDTRAALVATLTHHRYTFREFILSPAQFAVPYSRPRYFCVARRRPFATPTAPGGAPWRVPPKVLRGCTAAEGAAAAAAAWVRTCCHVYRSTRQVWQAVNIGKAPRIPNNLRMSGAVHGQIASHCSGVVCQTLPVLRCTQFV